MKTLNEMINLKMNLTLPVDKQLRGIILSILFIISDLSNLKKNLNTSARNFNEALMLIVLSKTLEYIKHIKLAVKRID